MNWTSEGSEVRINPRHPFFTLYKNAMNELAGTFKGHIWLATSGSSAKSHHEVKWAALSKEGLLISAAAVNDHLQSSSKDTWINPLPEFHVGGLGIFARAYLSKAKVIDYFTLEGGNWNATKFHSLAHEYSATLTSLVPAQVYDLVIQKLRAPSHLRAVIVGGGALSENLYYQALDNGWKLLPSYGLTECASQVATAKIENPKSYPKLHLLPHVEVKTAADGLLALKSPSLLAAYAITTPDSIKSYDPKVDGWFITEDLGEVAGNILSVFGRKGDFFKIGGESVDVGRLEKILSEIKLAHEITIDTALVAIPDERLGYVIHFAAEDKLHDQVHKLVEHYQQRVMPFEKIRKIHYLPKIPRSNLNKLLKEELKQQIMKTVLNTSPSNRT